MKKLFALVLSLALLLSAVSALADDGKFSLASFEALDGFEIHKDEERGIAFITLSVSSQQEISYVHKYESDNYYSTINNDILVINYSGSSPTPVFRTWIYYFAMQQQDITSVTFILDGVSYHFTDVQYSEGPQKMEEGDTEEILLIKHGRNTADFTAAIMAEGIHYLNEYYGKDNKDVPLPQMTMILHGREDIVVEDLPRGFWTDCGFMGLMMQKEGILHYIGENDGSTCKTEGGK